MMMMMMIMMMMIMMMVMMIVMIMMISGTYSEEEFMAHIEELLNNIDPEVPRFIQTYPVSIYSTFLLFIQI